jgi:hypothetical protein
MGRHRRSDDDCVDAGVRDDLLVAGLLLDSGIAALDTRQSRQIEVANRLHLDLFELRKIANQILTPIATSDDCESRLAHIRKPLLMRNG